MTKDIATFQHEDLESLLNALESLGYSYAHPIRKEITAWEEKSGEEIQLASKQDAIDFLCNSKGGLQLWSSPVDDVFISIVLGKPRLYFDGLTQAEQDSLVHSLLDWGLQFTVADEDSTFNT